MYGRPAGKSAVEHSLAAEKRSAFILSADFARRIPLVFVVNREIPRHLEMADRILFWRPTPSRNVTIVAENGTQSSRAW